MGFRKNLIVTRSSTSTMTGWLHAIGSWASRSQTLVIRPMQNEGPILKVAVVVYWVSYTNHRLQLGPSDWSNVEFRYERDQQRFLVSGVKHSFRSGILI